MLPLINLVPQIGYSTEQASEVSSSRVKAEPTRRPSGINSIYVRFVVLWVCSTVRFEDQQ